ncbi:hypothetical protein NLJ89_g3019 [Agrocybe chaxingu]|uniref:C2H2-type domain-containing protein n=1 Tax=Agrocybe chaxingu TaxID=84603 RepID=A0A9W8K4T4_9AGAR|nr:hypothetical protein NLJ89_g3019 [Agrocybe chaxingu]
MSFSSGYDEDKNARPTLPSIRDLFPVELELSRRPSTAPYESPTLKLAGLRVDDDGENRISSERPDRSCRMPYDSLGRLPARHSDPSLDFKRGDWASSHGRPSPWYGKAINASPPTFSAVSYGGQPNSQPLSVLDTALREIPPHQIPPHRNKHPNYHDHRKAEYSYDPIPLTRHRSEIALSTRGPWPGTISTSVTRSTSMMEDDERTPIARPIHTTSAAPIPPPSTFARRSSMDSSAMGSAKYECHFCGKGFTRPSSLKIHLNSHTGEKPFVCPVPTCGRSFSVLSNMRRHARVHNTVPLQDPNADDGSGPPSTASSAEGFFAARLARRDSIASTSSSSSRRSRSSSDDLDDYDRPAEKRTRRVS